MYRRVDGRIGYINKRTSILSILINDSTLYFENIHVCSFLLLRNVILACTCLDFAWLTLLGRCGILIPQ